MCHGFGIPFLIASGEWQATTSKPRRTSRGGQAVRIRNSNTKKEPHILILLLVLLCATLSCYDPSGYGGQFSLDDERLEPFSAMYEVDREHYCLTEIAPGSTVHIEKQIYEDYGYDVMLHIESNRIYRTVAFVWEHGEYVWIGEQESHYSGRTYVTPDGELNEQIVVSYYERERPGMPAGQLITYEGPYENIPARPTCDEALQIIKKWHNSSSTSATPSATAPQ